MDRLTQIGKSLKDFNYNNKDIADNIYSAINSTQFLGVSVSIQFIDNPHFLQYLWQKKSIHLSTIALW